VGIPLRKGKHEGLISLETFQQIQGRLAVFKDTMKSLEREFSYFNDPQSRAVNGDFVCLARYRPTSNC
jgi:hypothetical protein